MPQIFQVLRCYKCFIFQIHQTKKSNKWNCKMCGEQQSIKRHYGIGTGKDCRMHVQKLNKMQAEQTNTLNINSEIDTEDEEEETNRNNRNEKINHNKNKCSKWSNYIDEPEIIAETDRPMYLDDQEVVLEIPRKARKMKIKSSSQIKITNLNTADLDCGLDDFCTKGALKDCNEISCDKINNTNLRKRNKLINNNSTSSIKQIKSEECFKNSKTSSKWMNFVENEERTDCKTNEDKFITITQPSVNSHNIEEHSSDTYFDNETRKLLNSYKIFTKTEECSSKKAKSSKWAQFTESEEIFDLGMNMNSSFKDPTTDESECSIAEHGDFAQITHNAYKSHNNVEQDLGQNTANTSPNETASNNNSKQSLFSMVDEYDLDSILDF